MDVYTTSFTYPRRSRHAHSAPSSLEFPGAEIRLSSVDSYSAQHHLQHVNNNIADSAPQPDAEAIQKLAMMAMSLHGCHISYFQADPGRWNFYITGAYQQVMVARGMILKECPIQHRAAIKVARSEILDSPSSNPALKSEVRRRLDEIASQTLAHIAVVNSPLSLSNRAPPDGISSTAGWAGLETERVCELVVTGQGDSVDLARVRLLVMLDELVRSILYPFFFIINRCSGRAGFMLKCARLIHKLHAIIAGRKRAVLQSIQEETATNIYFPSPLQGLIGPEHSGSDSATAPNARNGNVIWITGEFFGVQRARDMLFQVSVNKSKSVISRDTAILPRKLDWMVTDRADDLKSIVSDNATFIQFPPLGSSTSLITVYGDHRVNIQRTIRSIMALACNYYVGSFWLLPIQFNALLPPATLNASQVTNLLKQISVASGAEVVFKSMCFEMHGLEPEVRSAVNMVMELEMIQAFHHEIRFQIELANEHREFISGKKNGKINKIMQTTNVKIKFETFNDHNFLIDIAGPDGSVLQGLSLLQEELPAEISFHVPEAYHKRIIGVGGRSIQRIMKKYGVYVKFSNAEEFAALGGYNDNDDNVVARTPAKNAINLDNLKQSVMELVNPKDKDYINETVSIPRRYHRTLLGEKSIFIRNIETKTNSQVRFPYKETASDIVTIFGPESQVQMAAAMLLDNVPFEADMNVPPSAELARLCVSPDFNNLAERIKRELQVTVVPNIKMPVVNEDNGTETPSEYAFKFRCQRSNSDFLITAREMLEQFLGNHNIHLFPAPASHVHKRGDSFAEAFPHFDSKLLSTARTHTLTRSHDMRTPHYSFDSSPESDDLGRPDIAGDRRLRMANSSPDVKALFNSPAYIYNLEEHGDPQASTYLPGNSLDYWTPLPPIGSGIPHRTRHSTEDAANAAKRGSDSLLESKLKDQLTKPRSLQNRAQSLDLTYSLSRITESSSRLPPPESPTTSTGETGGNSSPTSVTAPSFPSVYGSSISRSAVIGTAIQRPDLDVEEVSRVISNLGL
ncbi:KH domain protein [Mycena venus]|uniref:KH domain protein n=1 Tax=Mycena venus TaxID=2733690 RepID=A0A8H7CKU7_9AGAR|nr:KH domain protein [Mycena venus]